MILPAFPSRFAFAAALLCLSIPGLLSAQDMTPPVVVKPIADLTVAAGTGQSVIKLKKTFGLTGITGPVVRFSTTVGNIDVGLLTDAAPNTVATFLGYAYASGDNNAGVYSYTNSLIQRAVPGFIVQGGGFYVGNDSEIEQIMGRPAIAGEAGVKNTRGTLAMALSTGPDSATGDFFFNVVDNANLDDSSNGGPFTVFGTVVGGIATLDSIESLTNLNFSMALHSSAFENVPVINYDASQGATVANLIYTKSITPLPLVAKTPGADAVLSVTVAKNTNPALVTATLSGQKLTLAYAPGQTGTATITLKAKNKSTKSKAKTSFTVTVQ